MNKYIEMMNSLRTSDNNVCFPDVKNIVDTYTYVKPNTLQIEMGFNIWLYANTNTRYKNFRFYYNLNNDIQFTLQKSSNVYIILIKTYSIICHRHNIDTKTYESIQFNNIDIHSHTYRLQLEEIIKFIN